MISFKQNEGPQLDFSHVLLVPRVNENSLSSRSEVSLIHPIYHCMPMIVANMDTVGTFEIASHIKPFNMMIAIIKDYTVKDWEREIKERSLNPKSLIPTIGTRDLPSEISKLKTLTQLFPDIPFICLDVANGYLSAIADAVRAVKDAIPHIKICAGNVVDEKGVMHLAKAGASIVKIGIGSGGVCLTRAKTGVGYPQFSAIQNVAALAQELGIQIVSDGGMTCPGDAVKAYAAGADFVMAGSYFAGHEETGLLFHGMSSDESRTSRGEVILDYRATEGREVMLKSKGSLAHTLRDLTGGLRSACTYLGVKSLSDLKIAPIRAIEVRSQINRINGVVSENL